MKVFLKRNGQLTIFSLALLTSFFSLVGAGACERTRVITDMRGRQVQVPDPLQRVALLGGPTGQIPYLLGARSKVCAVSKALKASDFLKLMDPDVVRIPAPRGTSGHIQMETLIMSNPQLVLAGDLDGSIVAKKTGLPVVFLENDMGGGREMLKKEIRFYADVFDSRERGEKYIAYLEKITAFINSRVADIKPETRKVVFHGFGPNHLVTLGGDTFMRERLETAACINATNRVHTSGKKDGYHSGLDEVSIENVLEWNPDILVIDSGTPQALYDDPRWKTVRAVQKRQAYVQPVGIFIWDRPTAEATVLHPLWLAKIAYPERFRDMDITSEVIRFYKEIMDFTLSREQAVKLLAGGFRVRFGQGQH